MGTLKTCGYIGEADILGGQNLDLFSSLEFMTIYLGKGILGEMFWGQLKM